MTDAGAVYLAKQIDGSTFPDPPPKKASSGPQQLAEVTLSHAHGPVLLAYNRCRYIIGFQVKSDGRNSLLVLPSSPKPLTRGARPCSELERARNVCEKRKMLVAYRMARTRPEHDTPD